MLQVVSFDNLEDEELEGHREEKGLIICFVCLRHFCVASFAACLLCTQATLKFIDYNVAMTFILIIIIIITRTVVSCCRLTATCMT